jgi:hypothetical protein
MSCLEQFELTIPNQLYVDWHRCFVFHKLALEAIRAGLGSPVWLGDDRIAPVAIRRRRSSQRFFGQGRNVIWPV